MRVGILGAGQLCRMMILAGLPLGVKFNVYAPADEHCLEFAQNIITHGAWDDLAALDRFVSHCDVVTIESENIPLHVADHLSAKVPFLPPKESLKTAQDRLYEKELFAKLGIPNVPYSAIENQQELEAFIERHDLPVVVKKRRNGYDGKGQWHLQTAACVGQLQVDLSDCIVEKMVSFSREVSIIAVRGLHSIAYYDLAQNTHHRGILHTTQNKPNDPLTDKAQSYISSLLEHLDYRGTLALELFEVDGELYANEMAPRVHNSGHWTIEGAKTSQFENHIRAICGYELGSTTSLGQFEMINILGHFPDKSALLKHCLHIHDYGKGYKPLRKRGHVTLRLDEVAAKTRLALKRLCVEDEAEAAVPESA